MDLPQEGIGPKGSNPFLRRPIPVFLRKPLASGDFPLYSFFFGGGGRGSGRPTPLDLCMISTR